MTRMQEILNHIDALPTVSPIPAAILQGFHSEGEQRSGIEWLQSDENQSRQALILLNQVMFGDPHHCATLANAVDSLGAGRVLEMALVSGMMNWLSTVPGGSFSQCDLCQHSLCVGVGTMILAKELKQESLPFLFSAGLFHDIGKVVLDRIFHIEQASVSQRAMEKAITVGEAEKEIWGIDHTEIGYSIVTRWNFPKPLADVVKYHHTPEKCSPPEMGIDIVHTADAIALMLGVGIGSEGLQYKPSPEVKERLNLHRSTIEWVASQVLPDYTALLDHFSGSTR